jgi:DNA-binding beta-propeller fold protein YncE
MKTKYLKYLAIILSALMLLQSCKAYDGNASSKDQLPTTERKQNYYKVWVRKSGGIFYRGILYSADENGVYVTGKNSENGYLIKPNEIISIKVRRKGKVGKSALIGGLTGFVLAGGLAYLTYQEQDCFMCNILYSSKGEAALFYGIPFGLLGTGVGALVSTKKEIFIINGDTEIYLTLLNRLNEYTLIKHVE